MCLPQSCLGGQYLFYLMGAADLLVILLLILGNAFIAYAILHRRRHHNNTSAFATNVSSRFVLSLSLADVAVGLACIYYQAFNYFCVVAQFLGGYKYACLARFSLMVMSYTASGYSLVAIAIDRYFAVIHALSSTAEDGENEVRISVGKANLIIVTVWLSALVVGTSIFYLNQWSPSENCVEPNVIFPLFFVFIPGITHVIVLGIVVVVHFKIHKITVEFEQRQVSQDLAGIGQSSHFVSAKRSARVLVMVVICCAVCWTPLGTLILVRQWLVRRSELVDLLFQLAMTLASFNYIFNTFLFSWKNVAVKCAIFDIVDNFKQWRKRTSSYEL
uniref:(California timema) hypothetical protein n=1 Tax=Timema californicum TaxID=61474 RepID=A0A7R9JE20_TIMCA|nr:unnamed protein product [Timema californicum]